MHVPAMLGEVRTSPQDARGLQMSTVHHQPRPSSKPMGSIDATSDATDAGPASIHHQFSRNDPLHQELGTTYQTFGTLHEASGEGSYTPDTLTFTGSPPPNTNQYQYPGSGATTRGFAPTASAGGPVHHGIGHNQGSYTQDPPQFTGSPPPNTNQYQYPRSGFIPSTEATTGGFAPTAGRRVHPQELYDQQTPSPGSMYQHQGQRPFLHGSQRTSMRELQQAVPNFIQTEDGKYRTEMPGTRDISERGDGDPKGPI